MGPLGKRGPDEGRKLLRSRLLLSRAMEALSHVRTLEHDFLLLTATEHTCRKPRPCHRPVQVPCEDPSQWGPECVHVCAPWCRCLMLTSWSRHCFPSGSLGGVLAAPCPLSLLQ